MDKLLLYSLFKENCPNNEKSPHRKETDYKHRDNVNAVILILGWHTLPIWVTNYYFFCLNDINSVTALWWWIFLSNISPMKTPWKGGDYSIFISSMWYSPLDLTSLYYAAMAVSDTPKYIFSILRPLSSFLKNIINKEDVIIKFVKYFSPATWHSNVCPYCHVADDGLHEISDKSIVRPP